VLTKVATTRTEDGHK